MAVIHRLTLIQRTYHLIAVPIWQPLSPSEPTYSCRPRPNHHHANFMNCFELVSRAFSCRLCRFWNHLPPPSSLWPSHSSLFMLWSVPAPPQGSLSIKLYKISANTYEQVTHERTLVVVLLLLAVLRHIDPHSAASFLGGPGMNRSLWKFFFQIHFLLACRSLHDSSLALVVKTVS